MSVLYLIAIVFSWLLIGSVVVGIFHRLGGKIWDFETINLIALWPLVFVLAFIALMVWVYSSISGKDIVDCD